MSATNREALLPLPFPRLSGEKFIPPSAAREMSRLSDELETLLQWKFGTSTELILAAAPQEFARSFFLYVVRPALFRHQTCRKGQMRL